MGLDVTRVEFPRVEGVIDGRGFQGVAGVYAGIQRVNMEMTLTAAGMTQEQVRRVGAAHAALARPEHADAEWDLPFARASSRSSSSELVPSALSPQP